jgi:hypothetical protein
LKAASGSDVVTAETAVESAVAAAAMATPVKQSPGGTVSSPETAAALEGLPDADQVLAELARPRYDAFTDFWDMNRDMG